MTPEKTKQLLTDLHTDLKQLPARYDVHVQIEAILRHYQLRAEAGCRPCEEKDNAGPAPKPEKVKSNG